MSARKLKVACALLTALASTAVLVTTASADPGPGPGTPSTGIVLVLLDRSGSMHDPGKNCIDENGAAITTSIRKWECAVKAAEYHVKNGDAAGTKRYFLWAFGTLVADPTNPQPFWNIDASGAPVADSGTGIVASAAVNDSLAMNQADVLGALTALDSATQGPTTDDAGTPLAGAYCTAIQALAAYRDTRSQYPLTVILESDGLENATPPMTLCQGIDSFAAGFNYVQGDPNVVELTLDSNADPHILTADGMQVPSWQTNMLDMAVTGTQHAPDSTGLVLLSSGALQVPPGFPNFTTNIDFINEFIAAQAAFAFVGPSVDAPPPRAAALAATLPAATAGDPGDPGLNFFNGLANLTGGRLITFGDGSTPQPGDPTAPHSVPGDIDDSGCVDLADFGLLQKFYGQKVSASQPQSFAADINTDGIIDINDYLMMQASWANGCASSPGSFPVLQQSMFGFDSLASWSSTAPLGLVGVPRTEGDFSMSIGGSGWRTLSSIATATSSFQGVTSNLAIDVALPTTPSNPFWLGQVLLFVNCPSAGIFNLSVGAVELTGKPLGSFSTIEFALPQSVKDAMVSSHSDFSFTIALNANDPGYLVDNMRFVP